MRGIVWLRLLAVESSVTIRNRIVKKPRQAKVLYTSLVCGDFALTVKR